MRATILFVFFILFGIIAEESVAQPTLTLPPVFEGMPITEGSVKTFPSEDRGGSFIAIRVRAAGGVSPLFFFEEEMWKRQVNIGKFITNPNPDPQAQYASMFCALNGTVPGACASAELMDVDANVPWLIPVATVRAEYVEAAIAELVSRNTANVAMGESFAHPTPTSGQGPEIPSVNSYERPLIWDDEPAPSINIVWDDAPQSGSSDDWVPPELR